jgi:hypothetical protein
MLSIIGCRKKGAIVPAPPAAAVIPPDRCLYIFFLKGAFMMAGTTLAGWLAAPVHVCNFHCVTDDYPAGNIRIIDKW